MKSFTLFLVMLLTLATVSLPQVKKIVSNKNESSITYMLKHPLHEIEAVSRDAYCDVYVDPDARQFKHAFVKVNVSTFNSGNSNRDSHAMEVIEALSFPEARFSSSAITASGDSILITGKMTFHGVTRDESIHAKVIWENGKFKIDGKFELSLTAYKVERPSLLMVPVEDNLRFSFEEVFTI